DVRASRQAVEPASKLIADGESIVSAGALPAGAELGLQDGDHAIIDEVVADGAGYELRGLAVVGFKFSRHKAGGGAAIDEQATVGIAAHAVETHADAKSVEADMRI